MAAVDIFASDFLETPYWWRGAPRPPAELIDLPKSADAVIVGCGITGLNAAIDLARAGRSVLVLDKGDLGAGASSRNAGYVGRTLKHSFLELMASHGLAHAKRVYEDLQAAFDSVFARVEADRIACHLVRCGRLVVVHSAGQARALEAEWQARAAHLGKPFEMLRGDRLRAEIASPLYQAAALIPDLASIHPGLYHLGLIDVARKAGVAIAPLTEVTRVSGEGGRLNVMTARGIVAARNVFLATNGYTGGLWPYLKRRIIPFDAFMIATELLEPARLEKLLPNSRTYIDDNLNVTFVRRAPDSPRILFGGRTGSRFPGLGVTAEKLHGDLVRVLPDLAGVRVSNVWTGRCSGTRDLNPHLGVHDGVHFAGGYCFAGVPMGTYFGRTVAAMMLGQPSRSVFAELAFKPVPAVARNALLVPLMMAHFDRKDRAAMRTE